MYSLHQLFHKLKSVHLSCIWSILLWSWCLLHITLAQFNVDIKPLLLFLEYFFFLSDQEAECSGLEAHAFSWVPQQGGQDAAAGGARIKFGGEDMC